MYIDFLVWLWYNMDDKNAPIMIFGVQNYLKFVHRKWR